MNTADLLESVSMPDRSPGWLLNYTQLYILRCPSAPVYTADESVNGAATVHDIPFEDSRLANLPNALGADNAIVRIALSGESRACSRECIEKEGQASRLLALR